MKKNCWEVKNCGRKPGGEKVSEFGICPAATITDLTCTGKNEGQHAGRYCWRVAGTFCGGKVQGSFAAKQSNCVVCEFFKQVREEEEENFEL